MIGNMNVSPFLARGSQTPFPTPLYVLLSFVKRLVIQILSFLNSSFMVICLLQ